MRLIDADALGKEDRPIGKIMMFGGEYVYTQTEIDSAPTVDAVPVVRCRECQHRDPEDHKCDCGQFERQGCPFPVDDDYFCKYGERKGGDE